MKIKTFLLSLLAFLNFGFSSVAIAQQTDSLSLQDIYFETNRYDVTPDFQCKLDFCVEFLKKNPNVKIKLVGYSDERGTDSFNVALSKRRIQAVATYLIQHGAPSYQIKAESKKAIYSSTGDWNEHLNRRVEIWIMR